MSASSSSSSSSSSSAGLFHSSHKRDELPEALSTRDRRVIHLRIPTNFLILPPIAGLIGLCVGMSRGGSAARLRFLAENAHRAPTTVQGWYFYTKTRNYRMFFGAARTGGKYALTLSGATLVYVLLDESIGWTREQVLGYRVGHGDWRSKESAEGLPRRVGWREDGVWWGDGALAGGVMGLGVGLGWRLPRPLMVRSLILGTIMGTLTSSLQLLQARIGRMRIEQAEAERSRGETQLEGSTASEMPNTGVIVGQSASVPPVDFEEVPVSIEAERAHGTTWSRKLTSWIPGWGR